MFERATLNFFFLQFLSPLSFDTRISKILSETTPRKNISEKNNNWNIFLEDFRRRVKIQINQ